MTCSADTNQLDIAKSFKRKMISFKTAVPYFLFLSQFNCIVLRQNALCAFAYLFDLYLTCDKNKMSDQGQDSITMFKHETVHTYTLKQHITQKQKAMILKTNKQHNVSVLDLSDTGASTILKRCLIKCRHLDLCLKCFFFLNNFCITGSVAKII